MTEVNVVNVFVQSDGSGGNPLGVVYDGQAIPTVEERQALAKELGYSETVFIEDAEQGTVDIHTPSTRLDFAGYPLIGAAWLLWQRGHETTVLRPRAGEVPVWSEGPVTWVQA